MRKILKNLLGFFLLILFSWGVYLAQISPEAKQYFYGGSEQERNATKEKVKASYYKELIKIPFEGDVALLGCWLYLASDPYIENHPCATQEELQQLIAQNQNLLDSYQQEILNNKQTLTGQTTINASRLLNAKTHLMSIEGQSSEALKLFEQEHNYWKHVFLDNNKLTRWTDFAITLVNNNLNLDGLENILSTNAQFTSEEYAKLYKQLEPIPLEVTLVKSMLKHELELKKLWWPHFQRKKHPIKNFFIGAYLNMLYKRHLKFIEHSMLSNEELCTVISNKTNNYTNKTMLPSLILYGPFGSLQETFSFERLSIKLIPSFHKNNARRHFLRFIIKLKENNIPSPEVVSFINNNQDSATNPLTGKLFSYDENSKVLTLGQTECSPDYKYSTLYSGEY